MRKTDIEKEVPIAEGSGVGDVSGEEENAKRKKVEITVYVFVEPSAVPKATSVTTWGGSRSTATMAPMPIQCGPFFFGLDDGYQAFKSLLAEVLPCKEKLLPAWKQSWISMKSNVQEESSDR